MAHIQTIIRIDLDPTKPIPESLAAIQAMINANPEQERDILAAVVEQVQRRLDTIKGVDKRGKPVLQSDAE